jgi:integrase
VVKKELKMLISIFNFGVKYKLISFNPFKKIKNLPLEEHFQYFPSLEDFKSVYMVASQVEKQLLVLLLSTSARVGEILNLKWGDIKDGLITLKSNQYRGDTCKERQIPIPPLAWKAIGCLNKKYTSQSYEGFIFGKWRTGDQYVAKHKLMKKLCLKAGVKFFALHSIRRLALSIMSEEKVPLEVISYILGQSKVETKIVDFQLIQDNLSRIALMIDKTLGIEKDGYVQISE